VREARAKGHGDSGSWGQGDISLGTPMFFDDELDAAGQRCPAPLQTTRHRLARLPSGAILRVYCDDPGAERDLPRLCREDGHELLGRVPREHGWHFFIRKGPPPVTRA